MFLQYLTNYNIKSDFGLKHNFGLFSLLFCYWVLYKYVTYIVKLVQRIQKRWKLKFNNSAWFFVQLRW